MGFEASGPLSSSLGADRVSIKTGSDRFVPVLPSSIAFPSFQPQVLHTPSNQRFLPVNSAIPTHQAQFSDQVPNALYSNLCIDTDSNSIRWPSSDLFSCQNKSTKRSAKTHSYSSASGENGETIFPSSDEAENQVMIDEKKQRRMMSNRESARRSRMRKQKLLLELKVQVDHLRADNGCILNKFNITSQCYADINKENGLLRSQKLELNQKLQQLHQTVNVQSFIETGHCNAASLSLEFGNVDQFWASS